MTGISGMKGMNKMTRMNKSTGMTWITGMKGMTGMTWGQFDKTFTPVIAPIHDYVRRVNFTNKPRL